MKPCEYPASLAAAEIAAGRLTAEAYVSSCLERVTAIDKDVRAWKCIDPQFALKQARERDKSAPVGPLHGIPIGFKDIIDTAELPTEYNSPIYAGHRPRWDASCVALAIKAGAIVMGKTETTEFAFRNPAVTRNPHNTDHTPGGSSSGSAAAVAAFMVPIAIGSQTGGSTIRPASYCGIVGYKPSFGVISRVGVKPVAESLDHVGVLARTVEDAAIFTRAVSGIEIPDFRVVPANAPHVGFCRQPWWNEGEPVMHEKLELAASTLARQGAKVTDLALWKESDRIHADQLVINDYELACSLAFEYQTHRDKLSRIVREKLESARRVTRERYDAATRNAARYRAAFAAAMKDYDFVLTPAACGEAPEGISETGSASFNRDWTLLGVPCLTVPAYKGRKGLPIGVQVVGSYGTDRDTLAWAEWTRRALIG